MNASLNLTKSAQDTFLVYDAEYPDQGIICQGNMAAAEAATKLADKNPIIILRITLDETVRDVSDEFQPNPEAEPSRWNDDYCHADHWHALSRQVAS